MLVCPYVRRRHSTGPTGHSVIDPPLLLSSLLLPSPVPSHPLDYYHSTCLEVNPPNIVHPLTSNPPSHSIIIIITTIISKSNNNNLPLTLPPLPIPLTKPDQTWISSQILSSSPLLPQPTLTLPPALPSAEIQPSLLFLVSPNRTAALPQVHPALPPLHQAALVMAALTQHPNRSYHRSSLLPLLPTSINGVSLRRPSPTL